MARSRAESLKEAAVEAVKPRLRGVLHQYAFFVALVAGAVLVALAHDGKTRLAMTVYAVSVAGLLGTSALYHRRDWTARARMWMRRLDHSMIFVLIAVWAGALAGIVLNLLWVKAPKPVTAGVYITIGWVAVAAMPQLAHAIGAVGVSLILGGGILYTAGAVIYALRRPNPVPGVFGYHEVFHALVVAAAVAHFTAVAVYALPAHVG